MQQEKRVWLCLLASAAIGWLAPDSLAADKPDPSGTWKWERTRQGQTRESVLKLKLKDGKLIGTYKGRQDEIPIEGELKGDRVSFQYTREFNGRRFTIKYQGKLDGDTIKGSGSFDNGERTRDFDWEAKRSVEWIDVLGTWKLHITTDSGRTFEPTLKLSQDGDKLVGVYSSSFGDREAEDISLKDNVLSWRISFENDGRTFNIAYKGKPRGDSIKGKSEFVGRDGEKRSSVFEGKRDAKKNEK